MTDRVLDQWLEHQPGDGYVQSVLVHGDRHRERSLEADPLDLGVGLEQGQLLADWDLLRGAFGQAPVEQAPEPARHAGRAVRVPVHQLADRVERVEQEVGMELQRQDVQPGVEQPGLEPGRAERHRVEIAEPAPRHAGSRQEGVEEHRLIDAAQIPEERRRRPRQAEPPGRRPAPGAVDEREAERHAEVRGDDPGAAPRHPPHPLDLGQHRRREQDPWQGEQEGLGQRERRRRGRPADGDHPERGAEQRERDVNGGGEAVRARHSPVRVSHHAQVCEPAAWGRNTNGTTRIGGGTNRTARATCAFVLMPWRLVLDG